MRRIATVTSVLMIGFVVLVVNSIGLPVPFRWLVVGTYEMGEHDEMVLRLNADGTFAESITFTNGTRAERNGKWRLKDGTLFFDNLWIPPTFPPIAATQGNENKSGGASNSTDPGNFVVSPDYEWGRIVLNVFGDDEVMFRKRW